ncbi:MAG: CBS domain-containing protein [Candidatus Marinimicrobia bacterium]|nr:CBS domain-containing protein [Candidatus Neomarinimicrobiota bacterium]MCF7830239.1 CBS domain-containing protein [Candidatus Neomarinimicrobiota bacterium]MCF7882266.1 CBS domain-containing protein [Candidatus Neomarinimicrobiota bacterium]
MRVRDLLNKKASEIQSTTPTTSLLKAIKQLNDHNIGSLIVLDGDTVAGIVTERDVLHAAGRPSGDLHSLNVQDVMTTDLITCEPEANVEGIMATMTENRIRHLPVLEDENLVGVISIGDVVKARFQETEAEASQLKEYIRTGR